MFTRSDVMSVVRQTGASVPDCLKAFKETSTVDEAIDWLHAKGLTRSAKTNAHAAAEEPASEDVVTTEHAQGSADITDAHGIDLTEPTPPKPPTLQEAHALIESLWTLARELASRGDAAQSTQRQKESLKRLLSSASAEHVQQGLVLLRSCDDPELWAEFSVGLSSDLTIGGTIKGWVTPTHQLNVARFVALHTGLFEGVTELDVSSQVSALGLNALGGPLAAFVSEDPRQPNLSVSISRLNAERLQLESKLTALTVSVTSNIEDLRHLPQLRRVSLVQSRFLKSIDVLRRLPALTSVVLDRLETLSDISVLTQIPGLTHLKIVWCKKLRDVQPLYALTQLTDLTLRLNKTPDLKALSVLTSLRRLVLLGCQGTRTFRPLQVLTNLTELKLSAPENHNVRGLGGLETLTKLTRLTLSSFVILSKLDALKDLTELTELYIDDGYIKDLTPLSGLSKLKVLHLCSPVADLRPLYGLTSLVELRLTKAKVTAADIGDLKAALPGITITSR